MSEEEIAKDAVGKAAPGNATVVVTAHGRCKIVSYPKLKSAVRLQLEGKSSIFSLKPCCRDGGIFPCSLHTVTRGRYR